MNLIRRLLYATLITLVGCRPIPPVPLANNPPETSVTREFTDDGQVIYSFSGEDNDGSISSIEAIFNGSGNYQNFSNYESVSTPIIEGVNSVEAIAYDNLNLADSTPATDSFISPSDDYVNSLVDNSLSENSASYNTLEKNVLVSIGELNSFYVGFLVRKYDETDAIINYIGHGDNLESELYNKDLLDSYGIPNLSLVRIPEEEIISRLENFINGGFN